MREHAYADPQARKQLEDIIHPLVGLESARQVQAALDAGARCIVFDIPLLVESGRWRAQVDRVLVVDCSPADAGGPRGRAQRPDARGSARHHGRAGRRARSGWPLPTS